MSALWLLWTVGVLFLTVGTGGRRVRDSYLLPQNPLDSAQRTPAAVSAPA
jgi:hypothetical protein